MDGTMVDYITDFQDLTLSTLNIQNRERETAITLFRDFASDLKRKGLKAKADNINKLMKFFPYNRSRKDWIKQSNVCSVNSKMYHHVPLCINKERLASFKMEFDNERSQVNISNKRTNLSCKFRDMSREQRKAYLIHKARLYWGSPTNSNLKEKQFLLDCFYTPGTPVCQEQKRRQQAMLKTARVFIAKYMKNIFGSYL